MSNIANKIKKALTVSTLALVGAVLIGGQSVYAASFSWTADFQVFKNSRTWTQNAGYTTIGSYMAKCPSGGSYKITLFRDYDGANDVNMGSRTYYCTGKVWANNWKNLSAGRYYFQISQSSTYTVWYHAEGTVRYP